jgi:hypothetical protein
VPAVSQQQREWAFAVKGAAWAKRHHFDNPGPLPRYSKGGTVASSTERLASKMAQSKRKNWMQGAVSHPGALHRQLGVPAGQRIPAKKIAAAANSSNQLLARRARLAQTFAKYRP